MPLNRPQQTNIYAPATPGANPTETDYSQQNALGIAKLLHTSPQLGEDMIRTYEARTEHSGSLLSGMWNAITSPVRRSLEFLGNIGSAAAEPFRNEPEGQEDNPVTDLWQGLTGSENTTWRENLVSYGAPEDSWLTTVGGLAGDIFLDPTNYLGAGGLGLGRDITATGAKELAEHSVMQTLRKKITEEGGMTIAGKKVVEGDDLPSIFASVTREEFKAAGAAPDMLDTLTGIAAGNADRTILNTIDDAAQYTARWVGERVGSAVNQGKSIRTLPPRMVDPLGNVWNREDIIKVFKETSRLGPEELNKLANDMFGGQVGYGTSGMLGRKAAAALGGVRFKFGIPFTRRISDAHAKPWLGYRWQTNAIPLIPRFRIFGSGEGPVMNKMGNFFRGLSGMNRLDTAIQESLIKGDGLWKREDMGTFLAKGFDGFEQEMINQGRYAEFRTLFGNRTTSMFMSASDRMGGLTAHLTPKAQLWRRAGYTGMRGAQELRNAAVAQKMFREFASQDEVGWAKASHKLDKMFKSGELDEQQTFTSMIRYLEGLDDTADALPDFLRVPAKQMRDMFPKILKEAKKYGASVGDLGEVFARRRSETALQVYRKELDTLTKQFEELQQQHLRQSELFAQEVGEDAARQMKSPDLMATEQKLAEVQDGINTILESRKAVELEIEMMDEYDNMIRFLRPNWPGEKLGPKAYFQRRMAMEARERIRGSIQANIKDWGRAKQITAQLERVLADKGFAESEAILRKLYPEALKGVKNVWEHNPFGVYAAYVEDMSKAVYDAQLGKAAMHVMGALGAVDNGLAMRINAYIPAEFAPRATKANARYGVPPKFKNLSELIEKVQVAIGGRVARTAHVEGSSVWAKITKQVGKSMEPWKKTDWANKAEYLDIDDIWDLREFDRAGAHGIGKVTGASVPEIKDRLKALESKMLAQQDRWRQAGKNPLDVDDAEFQDWAVEHMALEGELNRITRGDTVSRQKIDKLKMDLIENGFKSPIMLEFSVLNRGLKIGEGNHRIQAARELIAEGHPEFRYIPTRVFVAKSTKVESYGLPTTILDEAHANGTNFDWDALGYVPADMRPSELFAMEAGRLGKIGNMTEDEAFRMSLALHELNRAKAQSENMAAIPEVAFKKVEADVDMSQWGALSIPGLEDFVMHPFLAAEFNRAYEGMKNIGEVRMAWRKFVMGPWKKAATIYFPGFHARNFMGSWFNNMLGGVSGTPGPKGFGTGYYDEFSKVMDVLAKGNKSEFATKIYRKGMRINGEIIDATYRDLAVIAASSGIVGGNSLAIADLRSFLGKRSSAGIRGSRSISSRMAVGKIGRYQNEVLGDVTFAEQMMRGWESWGIRTTNTTENYFRGAALLKGLDDAAGDVAGARQFVMMRHGDYDELTDFENGIRDLIPFYKWMRTNLPFQIRRVFEDPAKTLAVGDVQEALIPEEERKKYVSWIKDSLNIPMPKGLAKFLGSKDGGGILTAQLPLHDLYISSGEFASSFLPVVRQLIETGFIKKNMFTGAPIEGSDMIEAAGWMNTTGLAHVLNAVGIGEKGADGKFFFSAPEMNLMNVFPIFARSRAFLTEDPDRTSLRYASFISAIGGVRPEKIGDQELNEGEREWYYNVLEPQLTQLRELGYQLPTAQDLGMAANQSGGGAFAGGI